MLICWIIQYIKYFLLWIWKMWKLNIETIFEPNKKEKIAEQLGLNGLTQPKKKKKTPTFSCCCQVTLRLNFCKYCILKIVCNSRHFNFLVTCVWLVWMNCAGAGRHILCVLYFMALHKRADTHNLWAPMRAWVGQCILWLVCVAVCPVPLCAGLVLAGFAQSASDPEHYWDLLEGKSWKV